jgi:preprotein translocase subunit SecA
MVKWFSSLIDSNEKELKRLQPLVGAIDSLEPDFEKLSDAELRAKTDEFRARLKDGESLDDILPEAYAAVREAAKRTVRQRHFNVQLIGGIVLHQGKIAEMKTGEGKTLVATLPLYLNALTGEGCHLVTVNDYLAKRDCYWMGPIYQALGVSVACINAQQAAGQGGLSYIYDPGYESEDQKWRFLHAVTRRQAYEADITYGTNNEFGFDYLRDNMVGDLAQCVQRHLGYAIVDEVDNILIDEARTPLIISGAAEEATQMYYAFAQLVSRLEKDADYTIEERTRAVHFTEMGMDKMEAMLKREGLLKAPDLYDPSNYFLTQYMDSALKAHALFKKDKDYVVKDTKDGKQVIIVDEFTGRLMFGRRYSEGLHQAIEAKERVKIQRESVTMATITFQNYFRMYKKLAGMTGTAVTEAEEFHKIYNLEVVVIPTNKPLIRVEHPDQIYKDEKSKFAAVAREVKELYEQKRPVLIGTTSVEKSEDLSGILQRNGVPHQILNAKHHEKEADIIAQAGQPGAVTVATNMAGRGVDIILGGTAPSYKPYEDLKEHVVKEMTAFVGDRLALLKDQKEDTGWADAYKQRVADKEKGIRQIQEQLGALIARYYQQFDQEDEAAEGGTERQLELRKIEQMEATLGQAVEDYFREYERWAQEIEEKLKQKAGEVQDPGKDPLSQKIKNLLSHKTQRGPTQSSDLVSKRILEARTQFKEWRERNRKVVELGGLHIVGTEHHEARRIDNQLRGRAGRQGDPGSSRFYASMEDEIIRRFGGDRVKGIMQWAGMDENTPIEHSFATKAMTNSQVQTEGYHFNIRKHLVEYDDVVNTHREVIYAQRNKILSGVDLKANILSMVKDEIDELMGEENVRLLIEHEIKRRVYDHFGRNRDNGNLQALVKSMSACFPIPDGLGNDILSALNPEEIIQKLVEHARRLFKGWDPDADDESTRLMEHLVVPGLIQNHLTDQILDVRGRRVVIPGIFTELPPNFEPAGLSRQPFEQTVNDLVRHSEDLYGRLEQEVGVNDMRRREREIMLWAIDRSWMNHLTEMDRLRQGIGLRSVGQEQPLVVYKREGHASFENLLANIRHDVAHTIYHVGLAKQASQKKKEAVPVGKRVGRNDPCPCGSGKKYKHCCGQ